MSTKAKTIKVRQIGSAIRRHHTQRETLIGLNLNRINSSLVIAAVIVGCILLMPQRGGYHPRKA